MKTDGREQKIETIEFLLIKKDHQSLNSHIEKAKAKKTPSDYWFYNSHLEVELGMRFAIMNGLVDVVKSLLDAGVFVNGGAAAPDELKLSFLTIAAQSGRLSIVKLLLEKGAETEVNLGYGGPEYKPLNFPLSAAVEANKLTVVEYLLQCGMSPDEEIPVKGSLYNFQLVVFAAWKGYESIVEVMFRYGDMGFLDFAISDAHQIFCDESLRFCSKESYKSIVKMLLDCAMGQDIRIREHYHGYLNIKTEEQWLRCFLQPFTDVSQISFIGVSIQGEPITKALLKNAGINGNAIVAPSDINLVEDQDRRDNLKTRLGMLLKTQGAAIGHEGEVIDLVPLSAAAKKGKADVVKTRLVAGVSPNLHKPIVLAAENGHMPVVRLLAEHPNIDKKCFIEAIDNANKKGHKAISDYLFEKQDVNNPDEKGNTLLHKAARNQDLDQVLALIKKGAKVNALNTKNESPLILVVKHSSKGKYGVTATIVDALLKNGANANFVTSIVDTALSLAVKNGDAQSVALLLPHTEKKDLILYKDKRHYPWYHYMLFDAIKQNNSIEILTLLKSFGTDFNYQSIGGVSLIKCVIKSLPSFDTVTELAYSLGEAGYAKHHTDDYDNALDNCSAQVLQAIKEKVSLVYFLLNNGVDIKASDAEGLTPLHYLIVMTNINYAAEIYQDLLEYFLKKGADLSAKTKNGSTPLHLAVGRGDAIAIKFLVGKGADINAVNGQRQTSLHLAATAGLVTTTKLLVELGAVTSRDAAGMTPLELCNKSELSDKRVYIQPDGSKVRESGQKYRQTREILRGAPSVQMGNNDIGLFREAPAPASASDLPPKDIINVNHQM